MVQSRDSSKVPSISEESDKVVQGEDEEDSPIEVKKKKESLYSRHQFLMKQMQGVVDVQ